MSLRVWLPLNGSLENQGLSDINLNATPTYATGGKIGNQCLASQLGWFAVPDMANKKQMSFAYWVKINTATSTNWLDTFSWYSTNGSTSHRSRQEFYTNSTQTGVWFQGSSIGTTFRNTVGDWNHYVFTIDYDKGEAKFYINGEELSTPSLAVDTTHYIKGTGSAFLLRENGLDSHINDFRLYDHVLSPQEIKKISQGLILHYLLNRRGFGQENLHKNSDTITSNWTIEKGSRSNGIATLNPTSSGDCRIYQMPANGDWTWTIGKVYTASIDAKSSNGGIFNFFPYGGADVMKEYELTSEWKRYSFTFTATKSATGSMSYRANNIVGTSLQLRHPKLEEGQTPTPWCPNSSDVLADTLELNGNIQYDASGYKRNGQQFNLTYDSNTPKYNVSTVFTSANHSLIKIPRDTFVIQGSKAMTWSIWAYMEDWSTYNARIYSCTESGGVNIQLSSNNLKWVIRAYTNEEKTTSSYISSLYTSIARTAISSGWHLFTWTYTTEGTKLYIDGQLHMQKEGVSYGIFFNATAPLIIGAEATGSSYSSPYFEGKMSDFRIYATALSAEDVLSLYQNEAIIESDGTIRGKIR